MNILDLDDDATWVETYRKFFKEDPYGSVIDDALSQETQEEICRIFDKLQSNIERIESGEHLSFRYRLLEMFKRTYTDVVAYHACQPKNVQSYYDKGIIPSDPEKLVEEARIFFKDFKDIETVLECFNEIDGKAYLDYGRNTVGFFCSGAGSLENNQFLGYGSELYFPIANQLEEKEKALQKLSSQGTPTLFRCRIPISWLNEFVKESNPILEHYARSPFIMLLERLACSCWPERKQYDNPFRGDFLLKRSLPKKQILGHIDMTSRMALKKQ